MHDWCYTTTSCMFFQYNLPYFVPYKWKCNGGAPYCGKYPPGEGEGSHGVTLFQLETGQEETAVVTNCASATESLSPVCPALNVLTARRCVNLPGDISRIFSWVSELEW